MKLKDIDILKVGNTIGLVGAIYSGEGKTLLCYFPGEKEDYPMDELDMDQADWEKFLRQTDLMETEILIKAADGKITKAIIRKSQRNIDQNISWNVFRRDNYTCRYCGKNDVPLTVDHLILFEELGATAENNLVAACKRCNKARGNMKYGEWLFSGYYNKVSSNLSQDVKDSNFKLLETLGSIDKAVKLKSR